MNRRSWFATFTALLTRARANSTTPKPPAVCTEGHVTVAHNHPSAGDVPLKRAHETNARWCAQCDDFFATDPKTGRTWNTSDLAEINLAGIDCTLYCESNTAWSLWGIHNSDCDM
jgi:hypothetical protein